MSATIRPVSAFDEARWCELYAEYRAFYRLDDDANAVRTTWRWVSEGHHELVGLVAEVESRVVGLATLRRFARPSTASIGLFLDDLYVAVDARGKGIAAELLQAASRIAADDGATIVRWITATDNTTARRLYDRVARATPWVTYDMPPASD